MNAFQAAQEESAYDDSDRPSGTVLKAKQRVDPRVERELEVEFGARNNAHNYTIPGPAPASAPASGPASGPASAKRVHVRRQTPVRLVRVDASLVERSREVAEFVAAHGGSNTMALEAYVFATVEIVRAMRQGSVRVHTTMKPRSLRVASPTPVSANEDADIESTIRATNELLQGLRKLR